MADHRKHPVQIAGWNGSLQQLSKAVLRMRYDKVEEFFCHCVVEIRRQARNDHARNRVKLAEMLERAAQIAHEEQGQFAEIWKFCKPHMTDEL